MFYKQPSTQFKTSAGWLDGVVKLEVLRDSVTVNFAPGP